MHHGKPSRYEVQWHLNGQWVTFADKFDLTLERAQLWLAECQRNGDAARIVDQDGNVKDGVGA